MLLDLENVRARITLTPHDTMRLILEYPCLPYYRNRVLAALAELIRPSAIPVNPVPADSLQRDNEEVV